MSKETTGYKAVLKGKLKGVQCSESLKSMVLTAYDFHEKSMIFKSPSFNLGARGHLTLLEHSPWTVMLERRPTYIFKVLALIDEKVDNTIYGINLSAYL